MNTYIQFKEDLHRLSRLLLIVFLLHLGYSIWFDQDSTDKSEYQKSGMRLHTDSLTGLQYLSTQNGGLIKRTDNLGKHMNIEDEKGMNR